MPFYPPEPAEYLHSTWAFRFSALVFVVLMTKYVNVLVHGYLGTVVLSGFAVLIAMMENSATAVFNNVLRNVRRNQLLILLAFWYAIGVFCKMFLMGESESDWRFVTAPMLLLLGLLFGLAFLQEERCNRNFQVWTIMAVGVWAVFAGNAITANTGEVRTTVEETYGGWSFGDPGGYALLMILLPIFVWRAIAERGVLRIVLLICCAAICRVGIFCQFATPLGLLLFSLLVALLLATLYLRRGRLVSYVLVVGLILFASVLLFRTMKRVDRMAMANERVMNAWEDPQSGGYTAKYEKEGSRWLLAGISYKTFLESPFFGASGGSGSIRHSSKVGGHSAFFDMLGFYGLLGGGGAFIIMLLMMLARAFLRLHRQRNLESVAVATSIIALIAAGIVNPYWEGETVVMVFLFGRLFSFPQEHS